MMYPSTGIPHMLNVDHDALDQMLVLLPALPMGLIE